MQHPDTRNGPNRPAPRCPVIPHARRLLVYPYDATLNAPNGDGWGPLLLFGFDIRISR
jgi:hypothetical protein